MSNCSDFNNGRIRKTGTTKLSKNWVIHNDTGEQMHLRWIDSYGRETALGPTVGIGSTITYGNSSLHLNQPVLVKRMNGECYGVILMKPIRQNLSSATQRILQTKEAPPLDVGKMAADYERNGKSERENESSPEGTVGERKQRIRNPQEKNGCKCG